MFIQQTVIFYIYQSHGDHFQEAGCGRVTYGTYVNPSGGKFYLVYCR